MNVWESMDAFMKTIQRGLPLSATLHRCHLLRAEQRTALTRAAVYMKQKDRETICQDWGENASHLGCPARLLESRKTTYNGCYLHVSAKLHITCPDAIPDSPRRILILSYSLASYTTPFVVTQGSGSNYVVPQDNNPGV